MNKPAFWPLTICVALLAIASPRAEDPAAPGKPAIVFPPAEAGAAQTASRNGELRERPPEAGVAPSAASGTEAVPVRRRTRKPAATERPTEANPLPEPEKAAPATQTAPIGSEVHATPPPAHQRAPASSTEPQSIAAEPAPVNPQPARPSGHDREHARSEPRESAPGGEALSMSPAESLARAYDRALRAHPPALPAAPGVLRERPAGEPPLGYGTVRAEPALPGAEPWRREHPVRPGFGAVLPNPPDDFPEPPPTPRFGGGYPGYPPYPGAGPAGPRFPFFGFGR
jgi:hypothetical protein